MLFAVALQVITAGASFICTPTAVWDGDGPIWCAEGPRIRLSGVAAREMDGTCKPGHPCPASSGIDARDQLVRLLGGAKGNLSSGHVRVAAGPMRCQSDGGAKGNRTAAWCITSSGVDLNCAIVASGRTMRWPRYWRAHPC